MRIVKLFSSFSVLVIVSDRNDKSANRIQHWFCDDLDYLWDKIGKGHFPVTSFE